MSTITVTNIKATGETASRSVSGVAGASLKMSGNTGDTTSFSLNVASVTDNGTGDYTLNITSAFSQAQVVLTATCQHGTSDNSDMRVLTHQNRNYTTSTQRIRRNYANGSNTSNDGPYSVSISGDLA